MTDNDSLSFKRGKQITTYWEKNVPSELTQKLTFTEFRQRIVKTQRWRHFSLQFIISAKPWIIEILFPLLIKNRFYFP